MHGVNWFWISHAVHHSSSKLNLSAALRLGWGANLTGGVLFYLPLIWLGFPPQAVAAMLGAGLLYQFFLHVGAPVSFGPLGLILNSPQAHHVHHASNQACLDRNFGSVLIVFDRLFGSFQTLPRGETLRYGLAAAEQEPTLTIIYSGWTRLFEGVRRAGSWSGRLGILFGPPI
jgi:sterol desaturase/sphingolipid hydroxylase (fatty acid hydroxylase superfamily)